jgi:hypothetical protein
MTIHLYFSLIPEALIASMLGPEEFGQYYSTGHHYKSKGQAIFFEVDPTFRHEFFNIDEGFKRCTPHPDGTPKNSVYISVYRVLEHIPVSALGKLYLSTAYGHTLGLSQADALPAKDKGLHMYQDLTPINSLVVSAQDPQAYYSSITSQPAKFIRFPGLCFVELGLGALATDPDQWCGGRSAVLVHAPPAGGVAGSGPDRQAEQAGAPGAFAGIPVSDDQEWFLHG